MHRRPFAPGVALATLACLLALTGCGGPSPQVTTQLGHDLEALRVPPGGLIRMPEAPPGKGDALITATLARTLEQVRPAGFDASRAGSSLALDGQDLIGVDTYLTVKVGLSKGQPGAEERRKASAVLATPPPPQGQAGDQIAALYLWSHAFSLLPETDRTALQAAKAEVHKRLVAQDPKKLAADPYLLYRAQGALKNLGTAPEPGFAAAFVEQSCHLKAPDGLGPKAVLDMEALSTCPAGSVRDELMGIAPKISQALSQDGADDLQVSAGVEMLRNLGREADVPDALRQSLSGRVDAVSGLITPPRTQTGTVEATYLAARVAEDEFAAIAQGSTKDSLATAAGDPRLHPIERIMAGVALKRAGDDRWKQAEPVARQAMSRLSPLTSETAISDYVNTAGPALQLVPDLTRLPVQLPAAAQDAAPERLALAVLANAYLFANEADVRQMFPAVQGRLGQMLTPAEERANLPRYVYAAAALPNASRAGLGDEDLRRVSRRLGALRGCDGGKMLLPIAAGSGTCSLTLTYVAHGLPLDPKGT